MPERARAIEFLLDRQDADGLWRDYELEPGSADAWITSVVGIALVRAGDPRAAGPLERARAAVERLRRPDGWGYNEATAADADSTAWATLLTRAPWRLAAAYLDPAGRAHTFLGGRFGSWAAAHDDVTPVVGAALVAADAPGALVRRVRGACLRARGEGGGWRAFWWATDAYALARNLAFLAGTGGVPRAAAADARRLLSHRSPATALEAALLLEAAALVGAPLDGPRRNLVSLQERDGGWPASPALLVPRQADGDPGPPHADVRRLLTTATALAALDVASPRRGAPRRRPGAASPPARAASSCARSRPRRSRTAG